MVHVHERIYPELLFTFKVDQFISIVHALDTRKFAYAVQLKHLRPIHSLTFKQFDLAQRKLLRMSHFLLVDSRNANKDAFFKLLISESHNGPLHVILQYKTQTVLDVYK